jgi:hypothetical protein
MVSDCVCKEASRVSPGVVVNLKANMFFGAYKVKIQMQLNKSQIETVNFIWLYQKYLLILWPEH